MNITAFSMTPLFKDRVMGGAQKQLYVVMMHLAEQGHNVTVLCTRREPDATEAFMWHENARVVPIFRFKQPYPEPYATPIYNIASAIQDIGEYLAASDVFYSHDGGFIFPYIYQTVPTVVSLRSIIFSETLQSAYLFQGDDLILISNYQRDVILATVGRFFPDLAARTHVIYNGLDFDTFKPSPTDDIRQHIPQVDPAEHAIALYPHRPEREKGILEVIETANLLVHEHGIANLRVLVPRWIESALSPGDEAFYDDVTGRIAHYGLTENFVFHQWVSQTLMPQYYSLGAVTFAIGSYLETFGNVPYESLACGTPSIVARVGPARELLPEGLIEKVDFGDVQAAAQIAARIIKNGERTKPETLTDLQTRFQREDMVQAYANIILNAKKRDPMPYVHRPLSPQGQFVQSPWVYTANGRQYHDFSEQYRSDADIAGDEMMNLYRDGWVVPVQNGEEGTA